MNRILKTRLRRLVLVTCKHGESFRGVLYETDREAIVLRNAEMADPNSEKQFITADGELVILWTDVAYLQFV